MDIFKDLILTLSPLLKQLGFNKKGNNFYLPSDKNYGIVNFQKSRDSTKGVIKFTINFGVYCDFLGQKKHNNNVTNMIQVEQCQWEARIGDFMPGNPDYWWEIDINNNLVDVVVEIIESIKNIIMPEINKRLSHEGLIKCWMTENYAGTTEIGRFINLTTLLIHVEDQDTLSQVVETFMKKSEGKPIKHMAIEHLKQLKYY